MKTAIYRKKSINRKKEYAPRPRVGVGPHGFVAAALVCLVAMTVSESSARADEALELEDGPVGDEGGGRVAFIRPHAGVGWASAYNRSGNALAFHAGGRVLFPAPLSPEVAATFGLEATYLQLDITGSEVFTERYAAVGVVLELSVVGGFNLGIGTLGYVGVGGTERNPFGVVTNLGWEPTWPSRVRPYLTLRTEWIFDQATYNVLSLSAGITFGI